jgi:hypothetical protein
MSSAVQTLTQVKALIGIIAIVVYRCCISQLEYTLERSVRCMIICLLLEGAYGPRLLWLYTIFTWFYSANMALWTQERRHGLGTHRVLAINAMHNWSLKSASSSSWNWHWLASQQPLAKQLSCKLPSQSKSCSPPTPLLLRWERAD